VLHNFINAINLDVKTETILDSVIVDINEPANFNVSIKNLENDDSFEIYSTTGVDIYPGQINLSANETKEIILRVIVHDSLKSKKGPYNFIYKFKNSKNELHEERLLIQIRELSDSFSIVPRNINPNSDKIFIDIKNNLNYNFDNINIKINSIFFDYDEILFIKPKENQTVEIPINKEILKNANAGSYLTTSVLEFKNKKAIIESKINYVEEKNVETKENNQGFIIRKTEVVKKNTGNVKNSVSIKIEKSIISYLFTIYDTIPDNINVNNLKIEYSWERDLLPNDELSVNVVTNWFYPIIILIIIIIGIIVIRRSIYPDLLLRKKVSFVKTKGGQFALKVSILIKSKKYLEQIKIIDKLPPLVELYDKYGTIKPNVIDIDKRKLEWHIASLNPGESKIFTYIIYSKIGVIGRFELPHAKVIYEKEGKVNETTSNKSFYVNKLENVPRE